jgi:hypothetical protein
MATTAGETGAGYGFGIGIGSGMQPVDAISAVEQVVLGSPMSIRLKSKGYPIGLKYPLGTEESLAM